MKRCLNNKELVSVHAGDGSSEARMHLESCLTCTRRYRGLQGDLEIVVAALRQSRPLGAREAGISATTPGWQGLGWSLAASVMVAAFVCGRLTGGSTSGAMLGRRFPPIVASAPASMRSAVIPISMAKPEEADTPATYGLYLDDLMSSEAGDQSQTAIEGQGADDRTDDDSDGL